MDICSNTVWTDYHRLMKTLSALSSAMKEPHFHGRCCTYGMGNIHEELKWDPAVVVADTLCGMQIARSCDYCKSCALFSVVR